MCSPAFELPNLRFISTIDFDEARYPASRLIGVTRSMFPISKSVDYEVTHFTLRGDLRTPQSASQRSRRMS